jgi:ketosteroid isomerase-like protein
MYRAIVAAQVRKAWGHMAAHDHGPVLARFAQRFEYRFVGDHALGGVRRTRDAQDAWFQRLFRIFPTIEFTVRDVLVAGWPWRTRVVALIDVRIADGGYRNEVAQTLELRWGRITKVTTLEDTQKLVAVLADLAGRGVEEAHAAPILDGQPAVGAAQADQIASNAG